MDWCKNKLLVTISIHLQRGRLTDSRSQLLWNFSSAFFWICISFKPRLTLPTNSKILSSSLLGRGYLGRKKVLKIHFREQGECGHKVSIIFIPFQFMQNYKNKKIICVRTSMLEIQLFLSNWPLLSYILEKIFHPCLSLCDIEQYYCLVSSISNIIVISSLSV